MCGITGFISKRDINLEQLRKMNNTIAHRGPDDSGEEFFHASGYNIGLGHRRLSILDLSALGHQPMHTYDKMVSIVYNGEIYNFKDIKKELDYPFVSECDTEVVLAAYLKWGIDCLTRFNGMFAFALYDHRDNTLYLARDRIGKKPLYYWMDSGNIVFASTLKPIMECPGFIKEIRGDILTRYLYQGYIADPDTVFKNVWKLPPGRFLKFNNGNASVNTYWDLIETYHCKKSEPVKGYEETKAELKDKLLNAVKLRMISDVPLGTFLSGGYDSSLITALAQSVSSTPVKTFCIGFNEEEFNEAHFAMDVAKHLGTDHTELYITEQQMLDMVSSIPDYYDEPFADSSQIPTMLVSWLARRDVTVVLSGDGGDEFFCGYNIYDSMPVAQLLDIPGGLTYALGKGTGLLDKLPYRVRIVAENRSKETKTQFGGIHYSDICKRLAGLGINELYDIETSLHEPNWQKRRMLLDMMYYLPADILCKVDRASMKYSLEARCPILDTNVMEYSFAIHHSYKYQKGNKKRILKDIAYDFIPVQLLDRPKRGFGVPIEKWLQTCLREELIRYSRSEKLTKQELFAPDETQRFIDGFLIEGDKGSGTGRNFSKTVWHFFVFQQWYSHYIEPLD